MSICKEQTSPSAPEVMKTLLKRHQLARIEITVNHRVATAAAVPDPSHPVIAQRREKLAKLKQTRELQEAIESDYIASGIADTPDISRALADLVARLERGEVA